MKNKFIGCASFKSAIHAGRSLLLLLALSPLLAAAGVVVATSSTSSTSSTTTSTTVSSTTTTTSPATAASIALVTGWNLVGNSVEAPITVATSFNDPAQVTTIWKWVTSGSTAGISYPAWAFYAPSQPDGGKAYAATKGYDFLTTINAGEGFWVNAKTNFTTPLPNGTAVQASSFMPALATPVTAGGAHALPHGWSLIATGNNPTPAQFDAALSTSLSTPPAVGPVYTNLTTLWAWNASQSSWYFWAPSLVNNGGLAAYLISKQYSDFATLPSTPAGTLSPTTGVWVNMP
jgi:hypothetical protein